MIADEFHFSEPDRGWAWQVPLLELPQAGFLLMSATLGDVSEMAAQLAGEFTGRPTNVVDDAERPVPLLFEWSTTPLQEQVLELVRERRHPSTHRSLHTGGRPGGAPSPCSASTSSPDTTRTCSPRRSGHSASDPVSGRSCRGSCGANNATSFQF